MASRADKFYKILRTLCGAESFVLRIGNVKVRVVSRVSSVVMNKDGVIDWSVTIDRSHDPREEGWFSEGFWE